MVVKAKKVGKIAKNNPHVNMRQIDEWRTLKLEMERLGMDWSRSRDAVHKETNIGSEQQIGLRHF